MHGGKAPGGPLLAGGRYSKYLPKRLAARYEEAAQDAELLSVSHQYAVLDALLCERLEGLDCEDVVTGALWRKAQALHRIMMRDGSSEKGMAARLDLGMVLADGAAEAEKIGEVLTLMEQQRRLAETEGRRLAQQDQFITAKEANVLMAAIIRLVTEYVPDASIRAKIAAGLVELVGPTDRGGAAAGAERTAVH